MMAQIKDILFQLIRAGIGMAPSEIPAGFDGWKAMIDMSFDQGLAAITVDGYNNTRIADCLLETDESLEDMKYEWLGSVFQEEEECRKQKKVIEKLAEFYGRNNIRMMLLKGYGLAINFPVPEHRQVGDVDVYLFGKWKEADAEIAKLGIKVDNSHHHHSVFCYMGQMVEDHFDFVNIYSHLSSRKVEKRLKELAEVPGEEILPNVFLPGPNLNALFVARHAAIHFASGELVLRQMLDWALLIRKLEKRLDWTVFWKDVDMMGMKDFVLVMVKIAVKYFGLERDCFHLPEGWRSDDRMAEKVLEDTLAGKKELAPKGFVSYLGWMLRRWWKSRWKHRIVYTDSLWSTFMVQVMSHLMKPASLKR